MADENEETTTPAAAGNEGTPPPPAAAAASPTGASPTAATPSQAKPLTDETDVSNEELYALKGSEFNKRLSRFSQKELKNRFGTDNYEEIKGKLDKLATFEAQAEETRKASLTKEQKLEEELASARRDAAAAKAQLESRNTQELRRKETIRVAKIASVAIDSTMMKYALVEFEAHLKKTYTPKEMDKLTDDDVVKYFKGLAKSQPRFARATPPPAAPKPKVFATNGAPANASKPKAAASGTATEKTARPGQPNTMTKGEIKKKFGVSW